MDTGRVYQYMYHIQYIYSVADYIAQIYYNNEQQLVQKAIPKVIPDHELTLRHIRLYNYVLRMCVQCVLCVVCYVLCDSMQLSTCCLPVLIRDCIHIRTELVNHD